jgi:hypothetical protein
VFFLVTGPTQNRKLGFAKLVVHATDLLTVDGLFLFKVVEALWEGTYYHGLCMPKKGGGQKGGYLRTVHVPQIRTSSSNLFENYGYIPESVL